MRCLKCGRVLSVTCEVMDKITMDQPFQVRYESQLRTCLGCSLKNVNLKRDDGTQSRHNYRLHEEHVGIGPQGLISNNNSDFNNKPVLVWWMWHPFANDRQWNDRVIRTICDATLGLHNVYRLLLILPDGIEWTGQRSLAEAELDIFDCVWRLPRTATSDASGPYPSLRAERTIKASLAMYPVVRINHVWPAITLPTRDLKNRMSIQEMSIAWSKYSQQNITVE